MKVKFEGKRKMTETTNLIAKWLSEILKPDDPDGVYSRAYWEAWAKETDPARPPDTQDTENGEDGNHGAE
jgi:hypothetical protein